MPIGTEDNPWKEDSEKSGMKGMKNRMHSNRRRYVDADSLGLGEFSRS
jgi:hypothetical protein